MHIPIDTPKQTNRNGITLVEVIFAIGVALIGLVGLVSVLPIAGRRAQSAVNLNEGAALANNVFDELRARGALERAAWRVRADFDSSTTRARTRNMTLGMGATIDPGLAPADAIDNSLAFCIDPLFFSTSHSSLPEPRGSYVDYQAIGGNGYRRMLFPFYRAEHSPLVDPSLGTSDDTTWFAVNTTDGTRSGAGDFGSRMVRIGLAGPVVGAQTARESEAVVDDRNGVAINRTRDRSLHPTIQGQRVFNGGAIYGKQLSDGGLSWIATCNQLPGTQFMSVSVVIMHQRDRGFFTRQSDSGVAPNERANATDERLAWVSAPSGFNGGAGGSVTLSGAANTSDQLQTNDWIMLSRVTPNGSIHRWYRVVSVGKDSDRTTISDPLDSSMERNVWQHRVFLDGPDWSFAAIPPASVSFEDLTVATLVSGVVAVSEHVILIQ